MDIQKNAVYVIDDDVTYLCIGYADQGAQAILAPYWSDDEDCAPDIQNDDFLVVANPYTGIRLKKIGIESGKIELIA